MDIYIPGIQICDVALAKPLDDVLKEHQTTSDLGFSAARNILDQKNITDQIGFLIFSSRTPDYRGPATSIILQGRLELTTNCQAFDLPNGINAFEVGLATLGGLLASSNANYGLLIIGECNDQLLDEGLGKGTFNNLAAAILVEKAQNSKIHLGSLTLSDFWKAVWMKKGAFRAEKEAFLHQIDSSENKITIDVNRLKIFNIIQENLSLLSQKAKDLNVGIVIVTTMDTQLSDMILNYFNTIFENTISVSTPKYSTVPNSAQQLMQLKNILESVHLTTEKIMTVSLGDGLQLSHAFFNLNLQSTITLVNSDTVFEEGVYK